jgi:anti-anti-sigma regulatory factor
MSAIDILRSTNGSEVTLRFAGTLDDFGAEGLLVAGIKEVRDPVVHTLILDLTCTDAVANAGFGAIFVIRTAAEKNGKAIHLFPSGLLA